MSDIQGAATTNLDLMVDQNSELSLSNDTAPISDRSNHTSHTRACTNCVRAKAKCSAGLDIGRKCER
jgi:hypothetical protein